MSMNSRRTLEESLQLLYRVNVHVHGMGLLMIMNVYHTVTNIECVTCGRQIVL